jgi:hypothetical protein
LAETKIEKKIGPSGEASYAGLFAKLKGIKADDVDVGELSTAAVNDLYTSLQGIKDEVTARSSMRGLTKASSEFDQLTGVLNQLSSEGRKKLTDLIASIKPNLDQLLDKVLAIPAPSSSPLLMRLGPSSMP